MIENDLPGACEFYTHTHADTSLTREGTKMGCLAPASFTHTPMPMPTHPRTGHWVSSLLRFFSFSFHLLVDKNPA